MKITPQSLSQSPQKFQMKSAKGNINITWASSPAQISSLPWPERSFISHYWLLVTAAGWLMLVSRCLFETLGHWGIITFCEAEDISEEKVLRLTTRRRFCLWNSCISGRYFFFPWLPTISSMHLWVVATNVLIQSDGRPSGLHRVGRYGAVLLLLLLNEELCEKEEVELWQEGLRSRMLTFYLLRRDSWGHGG